MSIKDVKQQIEELKRITGSHKIALDTADYASIERSVENIEKAVNGNQGSESGDSALATAAVSRHRC